MENYPTTQPIAVVDRQRPYTPKSWWLLVQIALDSVAWIIGLVIGKHKPRINEDHIVAILESSHVLADAIEPTQRNDPQGSLIFCHVCGKSFLDTSLQVLYIPL